jgi:tetratricopeptide (TPR) repeat protein
MICCGWTKVQNGDRAEGFSLLRDGLAAYRATGGETYMPHHIDLLARACEITGQIDEAVILLNEALELVERTGERWFAAELHRHKGQLLLLQGNPEAAEELYCKALGIEGRHLKSAPRDAIAATREGPKVCRLPAGGSRIRTLSPTNRGNAFRRGAIGPVQAQIDLDDIAFVSNDHLLELLEETTAAPEQVTEAVRINTEGRSRALRICFLALTGLALVAIFPAGGLPGYDEAARARRRR